MLERVELDFKVIPSDIDENELKNKFANLSIKELGLDLAKEKALDISRKYPSAYVIGADQICVLDRKVYDKPGNHEHAFKQLQELSGKTHEQICSTCIAYQSDCIWEFQESAFLKMRELSDKEIYAYIELEKPFNACGSFMFEKHGKHLFEKIQGSEDIILGLPIVEILNFFYSNKITAMH